MGGCWAEATLEKLFNLEIRGALCDIAVPGRESPPDDKGRNAANECQQPGDCEESLNAAFVLNWRRAAQNCQQALSGNADDHIGREMETELMRETDEFAKPIAAPPIDGQTPANHTRNIDEDSEQVGQVQMQRQQRQIRRCSRPGESPVAIAMPFCPVLADATDKTATVQWGADCQNQHVMEKLSPLQNGVLITGQHFV